MHVSGGKRQRNHTQSCGKNIKTEMRTPAELKDATGGCFTQTFLQIGIFYKSGFKYYTLNSIMTVTTGQSLGNR